jgi:hypothetical protein
MSQPRWVAAIERALHVRRNLRGINRFPDPYAYFGPGGVAEAEALCDEANRDLLGFILPPPTLAARNVERTRLPRTRGRAFVREYRFDSPLPSGDPANDRVEVRVFRHPACRHNRRALVFHHPIYQDDWSMWAWFLSPLMQVAPVIMMAAPHHHTRKSASARWAGEMAMNPNPARKSGPMATAFLSKPAAKPTGLGKSRPARVVRSLGLVTGPPRGPRPHFSAESATEWAVSGSSRCNAAKAARSIGVMPARPIRLRLALGGPRSHPRGATRDKDAGRAPRARAPSAGRSRQVERQQRAT